VAVLMSFHCMGMHVYCRPYRFSLTDLQAACSSYGYSDDVYVAKVVDSDWCRCFDWSCRENHTAEVVELQFSKENIRYSFLLHVHVGIYIINDHILETVILGASRKLNKIFSNCLQGCREKFFRGGGSSAW